MVRTIVLLSKISPCGGVTQRVHGVVEARAAPFASDVSPSNCYCVARFLSQKAGGNGCQFPRSRGRCQSSWEEKASVSDKLLVASARGSGTRDSVTEQAILSDHLMCITLLSFHHDDRHPRGTRGGNSCSNTSYTRGGGG